MKMFANGAALASVVVGLFMCVSAYNLVLGEVLLIGGALVLAYNSPSSI